MVAVSVKSKEDNLSQLLPRIRTQEEILCTGAVWQHPVRRVWACRIPTVAGTSSLPSASLLGRLIQELEEQSEQQLQHVNKYRTKGYCRTCCTFFLVICKRVFKLMQYLIRFVSISSKFGISRVPSAYFSFNKSLI
jgi:hypothetical protein